MPKYRPGVNSTSMVKPKDPKYIIVAVRRVELHIRFICCVGPLRKQVPHKARIFPRVTWITSGVGFPRNKSLIRTKDPKLNKYPHNIQVPHPNRRSFNDMSGKYDMTCSNHTDKKPSPADSCSCRRCAIDSSSSYTPNGC